ncbi:MAG: hypothetical protein KatS3mg077_0372 [Candidatus Binatia bacterium]|nr:MAG: hypothetical protein KatS3mg077_0372 [Candidatus Binatia bacterium]
MDENNVRLWAAITTGIYILTTRTDGRGHGMSASWVVQVSGNPRLLAAAVGRDTYSRDWIARQRLFGLAVVGRSSKHLQDYFHSKAAKRPDNLDRVKWFWSPRGVPWLAEALLCLECAVMQEILVGDRSLFVAKVSSYRWGQPDEPLTSRDLPYVFVGTVEPAPRWKAAIQRG